MGMDDNFLLEDEDDEKTIAFIKNYLPQDLKGKFSDDELFYFLDVISEYYFNLDDSKADKDGNIDIDLFDVADYVVKKAAEDKFGEYDPDEIYFIVDAEMDFAESEGED